MCVCVCVCVCMCVCLNLLCDHFGAGVAVLCSFMSDFVYTLLATTLNPDTVDVFTQEWALVYIPHTSAVLLGHQFDMMFMCSPRTHHSC